MADQTGHREMAALLYHTLSVAMDVRGAILAGILAERIAAGRPVSVHIDRKALADRLGVKVDAVHQGYTRLAKSGLIYRTTDGGFDIVAPSDNCSFPDRSVRSPGSEPDRTVSSTRVKVLTDVSGELTELSGNLTEVSGRRPPPYNPPKEELIPAAVGGRARGTAPEETPAEDPGVLAELRALARASEWGEAAALEIDQVLVDSGGGPDGVARVRAALATPKGDARSVVGVLRTRVRKMKAAGVVPEPPPPPKRPSEVRPTGFGGASAYAERREMTPEEEAKLRATIAERAERTRLYLERVAKGEAS